MTLIVDTDTGGRDQATVELTVADTAPAVAVSITPNQATVGNGDQVIYTVTITNLTAVDEIYSLTTDGLSSSIVSVPPTITVTADQATTVPLTITAYENHGPHPFTVIATAQTTGEQDNAPAVLTIVGDWRVAATLTPSSNIGGPSTPVTYTLTTINAGTLADSYDISVDLPMGWTYRLDANGTPISSLNLTPHVFNAADLLLLVIPPVTAAPDDYPFTVTIQSQNNPTVQAVVDGTATIINYGVQVDLLPDSSTMSPTDTGVWQVVITNTGGIVDTYDLVAGGIVAASAQFTPDSVTLAPGATQTVQLTADDMRFALPQTYALSVIATSVTDSRIRNADDTNVTFTGYEAADVVWLPTSQTLTNTLTATYMVLITNTGNVDTIYDLSLSASGLVSELETNQVYIPPHMTAGILVEVEGSQAGTFNVTVQYASSSGAVSGTETATLVIAESAIPHIPNIVDDTAATDEDTATTVDVLTNDSDVDGDPLTVIAVTQPLHGTAVITPNNSIAYTPDADFSGVDSFVYTVGDGTGQIATATVVMTVMPVDDAPTAVDDNAITDEDTTVSITVLDNDQDVDGDVLTVMEVTMPMYGAAVIQPDNSVAYTPDANYFGNDSFAYTISDTTNLTGTAVVSVTIMAINDDPVAVDDTVTTELLTAITIDVLANDSDVEGDPLTAIPVALCQVTRLKIEI